MSHRPTVRYAAFMTTAETELEMVRRHVREGVIIVADQRARIAHLTASGLSTETAEATLVNFEDIQRLHEEHLARIETRRAGP